MHLVGLVVAGQHVHHDVDAGAVGVFALHVIRGNGRQDRCSLLVYGPGTGQIVAGDHDRRDSVAARGDLVGTVARVLTRLDPECTAIVAAGEVGQQIEGACQNVVFRHRFQGRDVDIGEDLLQSFAIRRAAATAERGILVAGIEEHGAAVAHIGVNARDRGLRGHRCIGGNRPVDDRVEGQFVPGDVQTNGRTGLQRRPIGKELGQTRKPLFGNAIDIGFAGRDIGEMGRIEMFEDLFVAGFRTAAFRHFLRRNRVRLEGEQA
ncbi:hypothetical protein D3C71_214780 [compost metagenome]